MKYVLSFLLLAGVLILGCETDKSSLAPPEAEYDANYFPNSIGTKWTYFCYDSLFHFADTVTVEVTGDTVFFGTRKVRIWEFRYKNTIDREYVEISGDTVKVYNNMMIMKTRYLLPFTIGKKWASRYSPGDSVWVVHKSPIAVQGRQYDPCYLIREIAGEFNVYFATEGWFVPEIGFVKKHEVIFGFSNGNKLWELMDYKISSAR